MAELLNCRICNGKVASDAPMCPHCGTPNYSDKQREKQETDNREHFVNIMEYFQGEVNLTVNDDYRLMIDGKNLDFYKNPKYNKHYVEFYGLDPEVCYTHSLKIGCHEIELFYRDLDFFSSGKAFITKMSIDYKGEDGIEILIGADFYGIFRSKKLKLVEVKCVEKLEVSNHCRP